MNPYRIVLHLSIVIQSFYVIMTAPDNVYQVSGVVGGMAQLPCNITPSSQEDSIRLILWFKENIRGGPIYSVDTRKSDLPHGKHFSSYESISSRASFDQNTSPAFLILDPLREEDIGEYKCRVDFEKGRTLITIVRLTVIVPPNSILITNSLNQEIEFMAGPYDEGSTVELNCVAKGGVPLPTLTWYMNGEAIDDIYFTDKEKRKVVNQLRIFNVSRDHLNAVLMCKASDSMYPSSFNTSITLDLNLKPIYVKILPPKKSLTAGRSVEILCETMYSRPPAVVTWIKNKRKMLDEREIISEDGNKTTSVLNLVPSPEDDGSYLICKAENIRLKESSMEDKMQLIVSYEPLITLHLISDRTLLQEGDSLQLHCRAKTNPPIIQYSWFFNGSLISDYQPKYKWINQSILSIDKVKRDDNGQYKCSAKNVIGYGESQDFRLRVNFAPICEPHQKVIYGVGIRETVRILCMVQAQPSEATFYWTLNGTQLPLHSKYPSNTEGLRSSLMYTPFTRHDYGSIECWAKNEIGSQEKACLFQVVPADYPEAVNNCSVSQVTETSILVDCEAGYDGGLTQSFHLTVYQNDRSSSNVITNITTTDRPHFLLRQLQPSSYYFLDVFSSNIRGRSRSSVLLTSSTLSSKQLSLEKHTQENAWNLTLPGKPLMAAILLIILSLLLFIILRIRSKSRKSLSREKPHFHSYSSQANHSQPSLAATSPDVIPFSRESLETDLETLWCDNPSKSGLSGKQNQRVIFFELDKQASPAFIPMETLVTPFTEIYDYNKDGTPNNFLEQEESFTHDMNNKITFA